MNKCLVHVWKCLKLMPDVHHFCSSVLLLSGLQIFTGRPEVVQTLPRAQGDVSTPAQPRGWPVPVGQRGQTIGYIQYSASLQ